MSITASQVKELRERTGAGMMECKKALVESQGDMDAAIEVLRKSGAAKAVKKAGRVAAEGQVIVNLNEAKDQAVMVEVNCETDFVAKDANFSQFAALVGEQALMHRPADLEALMALSVEGKSLDERRQELIAKIGENVQVRRFAVIDREGDRLGEYRHGDRIGVLVDLRGGSDDLAHDICMHIAASRPQFVRPEDVSADVVEREKAVFAAQAEESGKPQNIIEKMVQGRIQKFLGEITLQGQPFVKNPDESVGDLLKKNDATVVRFFRYEVGEGIEKQVDNFADEVMSQVKASH